MHEARVISSFSDYRFDAFFLAEEIEQLMQWVQHKVWQPEQLFSELRQRLKPYGDQRIRFTSSCSAGNTAAKDSLLNWVVQQTLTFGIALPDSLSLAQRCAIKQSLKPEWISTQGLAKLEQLGLPEEALVIIIRWLLNGTVPANFADNKSVGLLEALAILKRCAESLSAQKLARTTLDPAVELLS